MASPELELILDPWSGLSHRPILHPTQARHNLAPTWVGDQYSPNARRLNAYKVLAAYKRNCSRVFLADDSRRREHREYGDAALIVDAIRAAVVGEDMTALVDAAAADRPEAPPDLPDGASDDDKADNKRRREEFTGRLAEWEDATERQEWLERWLKKEKGLLKFVESERNAVDLGDGVYELRWVPGKGRARLLVHDPGFYFPVLDRRADDGEYPTRIHLAWEYDDDEGHAFVERITYELVSIEDALGRGVVLDNVSTQDGISVRQYPYPDEDDDTPAPRKSPNVCLLSWGVWDIKDANAKGVDLFQTERVKWETNDDDVELRDYDLGIDFIPVVHLPNTVALLEHFGTSCLSGVAQILDDLGDADTDLQAASAITGAPPLSVKDAQGASLLLDTYGPGTVLKGDAHLIDTSHSLDALAKYVELMLKRLSVNARVPEEVIGRVKAGDIASGVALLLSFGPFRSLINEMRLVRDDKYRLLFTFLQRLSLVGGVATTGEPRAGGALKSGAVLPAHLEFGSYLPSDLKGTVDMVILLLEKHGISRAAGLRLLTAAGLDLGDLEEELDRVEAEDFAGAAALANALGDEGPAYEYLRREQPEPEELPAAPAPAPGVGLGPQPPQPPATRAPRAPRGNGPQPPAGNG